MIVASGSGLLYAYADMRVTTAARAAAIGIAIRLAWAILITMYMFQRVHSARVFDPMTSLSAWLASALVVAFLMALSTGNTGKNVAIGAATVMLIQIAMTIYRQATGAGMLPGGAAAPILVLQLLPTAAWIFLLLAFYTQGPSLAYPSPGFPSPGFPPPGYPPVYAPPGFGPVAPTPELGARVRAAAGVLLALTALTALSALASYGQMATRMIHRPSIESIQFLMTIVVNIGAWIVTIVFCIAILTSRPAAAAPPPGGLSRPTWT